MVSGMWRSLILLLRMQLSEAPGTASNPSDWPDGAKGHPLERRSRRPTLSGAGRGDVGWESDVESRSF